jgi:DNA (cytosine-5)-methyltransferase 1
MASTSLLPTPTSQAAKHGELSPVERQGNRPQDNGNLWVVMPRLAEEALLPTPAVNDMGEGKTLEWWDDWAPRQKSSDGRPAPHGKSLAIEAMRMLPTPRAQDEYERRNRKTMIRIRDEGGDMTLPTWAAVVAPSIGATTAPPSPDGNTSSGDPHQHQLSLDVQGIPA